MIKAIDKLFGENGLWHMMATCLAMLLLYYATLYVPQGLVTWLLALPAAIFTGFTAAARANAIQKSDTQLRWTVRRSGLALVAGGCMFLAIWPLTGGDPISWRTVIIMWGLSAVWATTPGMQLYDDYLSGRYKEDPVGFAKGLHARVTGTHKALPKENSDDAP